MHVRGALGPANVPVALPVFFGMTASQSLRSASKSYDGDGRHLTHFEVHMLHHSARLCYEDRILVAQVFCTCKRLASKFDRVAAIVLRFGSLAVRLCQRIPALSYKRERRVVCLLISRCLEEMACIGRSRHVRDDGRLRKHIKLEARSRDACAKRDASHTPRLMSLARFWGTDGRLCKYWKECSTSQ